MDGELVGIGSFFSFFHFLFSWSKTGEHVITHNLWLGVKAHYNDPFEVSRCTIFQGCACLCVSHFKLLKDFHNYVKI